MGVVGREDGSEGVDARTSFRDGFPPGVHGVVGFVRVRGGGCADGGGIGGRRR